MKWYRLARSPQFAAVRRARRHMVIDWILNWRTVPIFAMATVLVASNNPWGDAEIVLPGGGETLGGSTTTILSVVGISPLVYRRIATVAGWRILLLPLACFVIAAALSFMDLVTILGFPADSDEEWFGLREAIEPTAWLWTSIAASLLGIVSQTIEIVHDRRRPPAPLA